MIIKFLILFSIHLLLFWYPFLFIFKEKWADDYLVYPHEIDSNFVNYLYKGSIFEFWAELYQYPLLNSPFLFNQHELSWGIYLMIVNHYCLAEKNFISFIVSFFHYTQPFSVGQSYILWMLQDWIIIYSKDIIFILVGLIILNIVTIFAFKRTHDLILWIFGLIFIYISLFSIFHIEIDLFSIICYYFTSWASLILIYYLKKIFLSLMRK